MTPEQAIAAINEEVKAFPRGTVGPKQRELMALITADHDAVLGKSGRQPTDAARYALHWFGPGGGMSLLQADPNMKVGDWVRSVNWGAGVSPDAVMRQNALKPDMTVGQLRSTIEAKMGGPGQRTVTAQTAGVTQPNQGPQSAAGAPSPVQPVQATTPGQGPQAGTGTPQTDQALLMLERSRAAALRQAKISGKYDQVYALDAAIAKRKGELADQTRDGSEVTINGRKMWRYKDGRMVELGDASSPIDRGKFDLDKEAARRAEEAAKRDAERLRTEQANRPVSPDGNVNETYVGAQSRIEAARGTEAARIARESELLKNWNQVGKERLEESLKQASGAAKAIPTIHVGRGLLDKGMITGTGANFRAALGNALATAGLYNGEALANTRAYEVSMGNAVLDLVKQLGTGSGITDADRKFAEKLVAGDVSFDEKSLKHMLMITEGASRRAIQRHIDLVKPLLAREGLDPVTKSLLTVDMPQEYGQQTQPTDSRKPDFRFDGKTIRPGN